MLAALFVCPPGVPQILGCTKSRHFEDVELVVARPRGGVEVLEGRS